MKHLKYTLVLLVLVSFSVKAQETQTKNYVKNTTYQVSTSTGSVTNDQKIETITYYDGLGRPEQTRAKQGGGNKEDILSPIVYDGFGRQTKQYLPNADSGASSLYYETTSSLISNVESYYLANFPNDINSSSLNPYSESAYDGSPLNRVVQQAAPGDTWKLGGGHEVDFNYNTNTSGEVKRYDVALTFANNTYKPNLSLNGTYPINTFSKTITKDENWVSGTNRTTEEFKDKSGRVILKKTYNNGTALYTYYVYDDYGNLTYVLPPLSDPQSGLPATLDDLCYQYKYDTRNRLVEKKIPGKGWEYIVYNKIDQPIMTQDPNLDTDDKWLFTKYDAFGRVAYTGLDNNNTSSRTTMQTGADGTAIQSVERTTTSGAYGGTNIFYNNNAYPSSYDEILTVNYYDTYVDLPSGLNNTVTTYYNLTSSTSTQGSPTVSKVKVLETNQWITTVSYYDEKGRAIYIYSTNPYLGTTDIIESKLDFTGKPDEIQTTHKKTGETDIVTLEKFYYDHAGRVIKQTHTINSGTEEVIAQNTYDGLGQLISKKVGNTVSTPLQTVNYNYNVRGWLKQINDPSTLGNDLFGFKLNYNTVDHSGTKLYNGNIAETEWKTSNDNTLRWYRYAYDDLNRINSATNSSSNYNLTSVSYDKNGNIVSLVRRGHTNSSATTFGEMDNLSYIYNNGNQLLKVSDTAQDNYGFKDGTNTGNDYAYDTNGNMTQDLNKNISLILYNHLNLPVWMAGGTGSEEGVLSYVYDATGVKLSKSVLNSQTAVTTTTYYAGNYVYDNSSGSTKLKFFNHPEGYVEPDGSGGYDYVYQYKDHLGNIRLSYKDTNGDGTITASTEILEENNYYPFGLKHKGYNNNPIGVDHPYGYNGVEEENALGLDMLTMDLRQYDPAIARWTGIDPVTQYDYSPYQAFNNSPVVYADPSGAVGECFTCFDSGSNGLLASPSGSFRQGNNYTDLASQSEKKEEDESSDANSTSNETTSNQSQWGDLTKSQLLDIVRALTGLTLGDEDGTLNQIAGAIFENAYHEFALTRLVGYAPTMELNVRGVKNPDGKSAAKIIARVGLFFETSFIPNATWHEVKASKNKITSNSGPGKQLWGLAGQLAASNPSAAAAGHLALVYATTSDTKISPMLITSVKARYNVNVTQFKAQYRRTSNGVEIRFVDQRYRAIGGSKSGVKLKY